MDPSVYEKLAALLDYPGQDFPDRAAAVSEALAADFAAGSGSDPTPLAHARGHAPDPDRAASLTALRDGANDASLEERYVTLFELAPSCVPYTGVRLFGDENFRRGMFLARLSGRHLEAGLEIPPELADHLSSVLRLMACVGSEERRGIAEFIVLAPLEEMIRDAGGDVFYGPLLRLVGAAIRSEFPGIEPAPAARELLRKIAAERSGPCGAREAIGEVAGCMPAAPQ